MFFPFLFKFFNIQYTKTIFKELGLTILSFLSIIFSVVISTDILSQDIKNKTIYNILTKPVSKLQYLIAKHLSVVFVSFILDFILFLEFCVILNVFHIQYSLNLLIFNLISILSVQIIFTSIVLLLSTYLPDILLFIFIIFIYFLSSMNINTLASIMYKNKVIGFFIYSIKLVLPKLYYFNLKDAFLYDFNISYFYIINLFLYAILYSFLILIFIEESIKDL